MIENYILHEQIGQGEYGKVYRATDVSTQSTVAVKIVETSKLNQNPKLLELSLTEIKVLQQVSDCPYIVDFIQLIKTHSQYFFVYEYCSGGPLDKMLNYQGHFQEQKALQILWQLLQAFKILQQNRIMHRDLKPSNILIKNGIYKLADFGFCKPMDERFGDVTTTMLGSPIYMAPEVLRGLSYDNRADIWSLGSVLYELLVGRCPFEEKSIARLITAQDDSDWSIPSSFTFKTQTLTLLKSMLIKDPTKRCTWDYLFGVSLTKDGEFMNDVKLYEHIQFIEPVKIYTPLQSIDHNIDYNNQYTTIQQYSVPYKTIDFNKRELTEPTNFKKEANQIMTPTNFMASLRENSEQLTFQSSLRSLTRANTFNMPQELVPEYKVSEPTIKEQILKNVLTEVIHERNKIYFFCKNLNDITKLNLLDKSSVTGYWVLLLLNRRLQSLMKVIKNYLTIQEINEYPSLNKLLELLQKRNQIKKLVNNFEFVRLVDTMEKEATSIVVATNEYKTQLDQTTHEGIESREISLLNSIQINLSQEQNKQVAGFLISYVNQLRSQYYLAFIDHKSQSDKHIVVHAIQILNSLQVDTFFETLGSKMDEVADDFGSYDDLDKKQLNDMFEERLKKVTSLPGY